MTIRKIKIFNIFFLFLLSFVWHYMYKLLPCSVLAIIFPVNDSIWEHMKIVYFTLLISSLLESYLYKRYKLPANNKNISMMTKSLLGVVLYLVLYIPLYKLIGEYLIISIILLLIVYSLMEFISYKIILSEELNIKVLPIIIVVLGIILFMILTFYPVHNFLFFDNINFGYGILK